MKSMTTEDLKGETLNRLVELIDEMFAEMDENENET